MATSVFIWPGIAPGGSFSGQTIGPAADNTANPPFTFAGDLDTGLGSSAANTLNLVTGGSSALTITATAATFLDGVIGSFTKSAIATTSTTGLSLNNATPALVGTTVQISPRFLYSGFGWDVNDAVSRPVRFFEEVLPVSGNTVTGNWKLGYLDPITSAATYPLQVTSLGQLLPLAGTAGLPTYAFAVDATDGIFRPGGNLIGVALGGVETFRFNGTFLEFIGTNQLAWSQTTIGAGADTGIARDSAGVMRITNASTGYANLALNKVSKYGGNIATAGWGVPAIYGYGDVGPVTNAGTASIATYTVGAADGTFEVSANCNVTTSTTHSFSLDCVYTDESNASRTMVIPVSQLAGSFLASGLITNVTSTGPYEGTAMTIRCKASTSITIRTSAGGTFTGVVYTARGIIKQVG